MITHSVLPVFVLIRLNVKYNGAPLFSKKPTIIVKEPDGNTVKIHGKDSSYCLSKDSSRLQYMDELHRIKINIFHYVL
jgi:hypothetical protein